MPRFATIRDLAHDLLRREPGLWDELGLEGVEQVIRSNHHLFERFEDVDESTVLRLLVACYVAAGVPEDEAEDLVS